MLAMAHEARRSERGLLSFRPVSQYLLKSAGHKQDINESLDVYKQSAIRPPCRPSRPARHTQYSPLCAASSVNSSPGAYSLQKANGIGLNGDGKLPCKTCTEAMQ